MTDSHVEELSARLRALTHRMRQSIERGADMLARSRTHIERSDRQALSWRAGARRTEAMRRHAQQADPAKPGEAPDQDGEPENRRDIKDR